MCNLKREPIQSQVRPAREEKERIEEKTKGKLPLNKNWSLLPVFFPGII